MTRALLCLVVAACVDPQLAPLSTTLPPWHDPAQITTYTLANGMQIALLRDPTARVASIDLRVEVGTSDDPAGHPGLAAELGYLLTDAPQHALRTQLAIDADRTEIVSTTLALADAIETEAHRLELTCDELLAPGTDRAYTEAIQQARQAPLAAALWGQGHPYAHLAANPTLPPPSPQEVCAFYQQHYVAAAATLVITGPIDGALLSRLRMRLERLPTRAPPPRAIAAAIAPGAATLRVPGLARATVAVVVPAPVMGAADDVLAELAVRRIASWNGELHVFLTGGRRSRALVIALEDPLSDVVNADPVKHLAKQRQTIEETLERADKLSEDDADDRTSEDYLVEQLHVEDVVARTAAIAEDVAAHRRIDRLHRVRALREATGLRIWIRDHVARQRPRVLYLVADGPGVGPLEEIGVPPAIADGDRPAAAGSFAPLAAAAPIESYTLRTGLRVVLAPQRGTATVDARLILPVGTRHEPAPGVAQRAAAELMPNQEADGAANRFSKQFFWYRQQGPRSEVAVTATATRFRFAGASGLASWHVFMLSWLMTTGHYESDAGTLSRMKRFYGPHGATLIVTGAFDPVAMRKLVELWFGPWQGGDPVPPPARRSETAAVAITDTTDRVEAGIIYGNLDRPAAEARLVAEVIETRLTAALTGIGVVTASYDGRSARELVVLVNLDPASTGLAGEALSRTLGSVCAQPVTPAELDHMRRRTITSLLEASSTAVGLAHQLEETAGLPAGPTDEVAALATVTSDALQHDCLAMLRPDARRIVAHGPRSSLSVLFSAMGVDARRTVFTAGN